MNDLSSAGRRDGTERGAGPHSGEVSEERHGSTRSAGTPRELCDPAECAGTSEEIQGSLQRGSDSAERAGTSEEIQGRLQRGSDLAGCAGTSDSSEVSEERHGSTRSAGTLRELCDPAECAGTSEEIQGRLQRGSAPAERAGTPKESVVFEGARLIHADGSVSELVTLTVLGGKISSIRPFKTGTEGGVDVKGRTGGLESGVSAEGGLGGKGPGCCGASGGFDGTVEAGTASAAARVIDCRGMFISPGLVNLHTHSPMAVFRGIAEDVTPEDWFNREIWPYESRMEEADVEAGARLAALEMADCGVTAYADHYFMEHCICKVAEETGLRLDMAPTLFGMAGDFDSRLAEVEEFIQEWRKRSERIALRVGPHSHYTCNPEQLARCAQLAGRLGVGAHLHVEDGQQQIAESLKLYGKTPMEVVSESGLTELPLIIAHAYWILPEERRFIRPGNWIAFCMKTYMKLGMAFGPVLESPENLPLCIGSDGAASSNTLNPLEQARLLALAGKSVCSDAESFPLESIWKMLMRGHEALPFDSGKLEEGAPADLVVWDLRQPHTAPVYNPLASLLYSADARNVLYVMAAGEFLKESGSLNADVSGAVRDASERARFILRRGRGETKLLF